MTQRSLLFQILPFIRTYPAQRQKPDNQYQLQTLEHMPQQCATQTRKVFYRTISALKLVRCLGHL